MQVEVACNGQMHISFSILEVRIKQLEENSCSEDDDSDMQEGDDHIGSESDIDFDADIEEDEDETEDDEDEGFQDDRSGNSAVNSN